MKLRKHLSYANVLSTLALFFTLTGGVVYAASQIGTKQIRHNAVTTQKIAPFAVTARQIAPKTVGIHQLGDRSVSATKLADGSVSPAKIAPFAVTDEHIAPKAVGTDQLGDRSVGEEQLAHGSVSPAKQQFPVYFVANPTGGSKAVSQGPEPYSIQDAAWIQNPGELNVIFGAATATLAYDGSGSGSCQVYFDVRVNGEQVGGGQLQTDSSSPVSVTTSLGGQPTIDPVAPVQNEMTIQTNSNGACTSGSSIDSSRFRILDFG